MPEWMIKHREETVATACPCGAAQRVVTAADEIGLSVHFVTISSASEVHYHRNLTEVYVVITGSGTLELDGHREPLREGTVAVIPPGVRHRAVPGADGLTIVNIVRPPFDPEDEHHD